ncbi:MAG: hypothetical protein JXB46_07870 [Candidatus Eisenbacteria bacterium]|nr:hypothetical protein [Candidatus Eisenbacteria bacterium]
MYLADVGEFPVAHNWCDQMAQHDEHSREIEERCASGCPAAKNRQGSYAFNRALSGMKARDIAMRDLGSRLHLVAIFESDAGWNGYGGPELLPDEPRHFGGDNYIFADGSTSWCARRRNPDGTWAKEPEADWVIWEPVFKENGVEEQGTSSGSSASE